MKKRILAGLMALCVSICTMSTLISCGGLGQGSKIEIDKTKTQLYIGNYDGGFGSRWLDEYKKGFEALYKDESFEPNKKGVEVIIVNDKIAYYSDNLQSTFDQSPISVVFTEGLNYYKFKEENLLYDISDIVDDELPGENKTILSKLSENQVEYYGGGEGKFYALPHFQTFRGFIYDIDLFDAKKLFIKKDGSIAGTSKDTDLSAGPNGVYGDYDDGLPATIEEFFELCEFMSLYKKVTPFIWTGTYQNEYTNHIMEAFYADIQGVDGGTFRYNYDVEEVTTKMISSFDSNGTPIVSDGTLSRESYLDIANTAGAYYMYYFMYNIIVNNYYHRMSLNSTETHDITHYDFLRSRFDPTMQPIAMMFEGTWWEEESNYIFESMSKDYEGASRTERRFGLMPFPKINEEAIGKPTLFDGNNAVVIVNGNCSDVKADLAKKFIKYISTDENLQLFNTITGVARDYQFSLTDDQFKNLSPMAQSVYSIRDDAAGIVYGRQKTESDYFWYNFTGNKKSLTHTFYNGASYGGLLAAALEGIDPRKFYENIL